MSQEQVEVAVAVRVGHRDAHAGLGLAELVERRPARQGVLAEGAVAPVQPQVVRGLVVRHVEIDQAVAVEVAGDDAQARPGDRADAGRLAHVDEPAGAVVAVQGVGRRGVLGRVAVVPQTVRSQAGALPGGAPDDVVDDEQVQVQVAVVVEEDGARRPGVVADPGSRCRVLEDAAAAVPVEPVRADVQHVEVDEAVPVVVAGGGAGAVARVAGAGGVRHVLEGAVAQVAVEAVAKPVGGRAWRARIPWPVGGRAARPGGTPAPGGAGNRTALDQVDVEQTVLVDVEQRPAAHQEFGVVVVAGGAVAVNEIEARLGRSLDEDGRRRERRGRYLRIAVRSPARQQERGRQREAEVRAAPGTVGRPSSTAQRGEEDGRTPHGRDRHYPRGRRRALPAQHPTRAAAPQGAFGQRRPGAGRFDGNPAPVIQASV